MKILLTLSLTLALLAPAIGSSEEQSLCPMMIDTEIDTAEQVEYDGVTVYLCCSSCMKLWEGNEDYYVKFGMEEGLLPQFGDETKEKLKDVELMAQRFCPL
ncbi:MAG: hypothetical protein AAF491_08625, partial [Verrucomicrobiota bacterium]